MKISAAAAELDSRFKDDDRGSAINVIIAVNENAFPARNGRFQAFDGSAHPGDGVGRMEVR